MRNRVFGAVLACLLLVCALPVQAYAQQEEVIYYDDGSYTVITVQTESAVTRATNSRNGSKDFRHYDSGNTLCWKATLTATFSYNGSSATCTAVNSFNVTIYNSDWSVGSKSTSRSGNTAYGYLTMSRKIVGGTQGVPVTVTLSCDKNGNLS